jgi:mannitol-1-phosphate 5-dehydrogenase
MTDDTPRYHLYLHIGDTMTKPSIVIWGAGSIGRGFVADLFYTGGYHCILVDQSQALVDHLRAAGRFTVVRARGEDQCEEQFIEGCTALHTSETQAIAAAIQHCDLLALSIFPRAFQDVANQLSPHLLQRAAFRPGVPLDILLCTNLTHAAPRFQACLESAMTTDEWTRLNSSLGLVETLVIRMVPGAPAERRAVDPLLVWTNGYAELPVDRKAFKGPVPSLPALRLVEDMHAEEQRKMFTYNMAQAVLGFHGARLGYTALVDCMTDAAIQKEMLGALDEASQALQAAYGFSSDDMQHWISAVVAQVNNRMLGDTVRRICADPVRKLDREDRLTGAARLAHAHGISTHYLARAVAAALLYHEESDAASSAVQQKIAQIGIGAVVRDVCGLTEAEAELAQRIVSAYYRLPLELEWAEKIAQAERLGFQYEQEYHGCGQCSFAAITDTLGNFDEGAFNAATGFSGGLALVGDSTCSALLGGVLAIGLVYPRTREHFSGDRKNKYRNFDLTQQLIERYRAHFGTLRCYDIHTRLMGRSFDLRSPAERHAFEEAGAHDDKCTTTVALAARWTLEILAEALIEEEVRGHLIQAGISIEGANR